MNPPPLCGLTFEFLDKHNQLIGDGGVCIAWRKGSNKTIRCGELVADHPHSQTGHYATIIEARLNEITSQIRELKLAKTVHGVSTEADFVRSLREDNKFFSDVAFNTFLTDCQQNWWPSPTLPLFPKMNEKETETCQPMVDEIVVQLSYYNAHRRKLFGGFAKKSTQVEKHNTIISTPSTVSFSCRKPDLVMYQAERSDACAITMLGDVKGRTSNHDFPDSEVGHILDMTRVLMTEHQYLRNFMICFLTDGYRFQFFKCMRDGNSFLYGASTVFLGETGWQILFGLRGLSPENLGLVLDETPGWTLLNGLGVGRFTRVYRAIDDTHQICALKFYPPEYAHMGAHEENILRELAVQRVSNVPDVQTSLTVGLAYLLLLSPVGVPILPAPFDVRITPTLILPLLSVLEHIHALGIIHRDVKPDNIYLHADETGRVIMNDWGSAVKTLKPSDLEAEPCLFQGTPLYGEQHINGQLQIPTKRLDLCSLVKTVFIIKQQKVPICGKEWSEITSYWNSVSRDFPEFQTVLSAADTMSYHGLRAIFQSLWC